MDTTPSIDEIREQGTTFGDALAGRGGPRQVTITLSAQEFIRIGGTQEDLQRLSDKVQDFVNTYILEL